MQTTTDYIGNMVYENDTLQFFGHPEGRVIFSPPYQGGAGGGYEYQYAYSDHLGNVRMLYTSNPESVTFTATMETEVAEQADDSFFVNVDETNAVDTGATSYNEVSRLFSSQPVGPGISLPMYPGDKATMSVKAYHRGGDFSGSIDLSTFIATLAGAFGGVNGGTSAEQATFNAFDNAINPDNGGFGLLGSTLSTRPAAYLNYILFDKNMKMYQHGHAQISESGTLETLNLADIEATKEGWIYVYLSNESNSLNEVYFDDMVVTIQESMVVQNTDYYPFGLQHNTSWTRPTDLKNNFLYNAGSELNEKTKNYETFFRQYDPALGRMTGIDPMAVKYSGLSPYNYAFNDPEAWNDPYGDDPIEWGENGELYIYWDQLPENGGSFRQRVGDSFYTNGGRWVYHDFVDLPSAFTAGWDYNNLHDSWGYVEGGQQGAIGRYADAVGGVTTRTRSGYSVTHYNTLNRSYYGNEGNYAGAFFVEPNTIGVKGINEEVRQSHLFALNTTGVPINTSLSTDYQTAQEQAAYEVAFLGLSIKELFLSQFNASSSSDDPYTSASAPPIPSVNTAKVLQQLKNIERTKKALELAKKVGRNRIVLRTPTQQIKYDLTGTAHFDKVLKAWTQTPHKHIGVLNLKAPSHLGRKFNFGTDAIFMTDQDLRILSKYLKKIGN